MTIQSKSKYITVFFSALVAFALVSVQPYSSNASDRIDNRDEMINHVYTPLWMGDPLPLPQGEIKTESNRFVGDQLNHRDEMINHVYTPLWMGSQDHSQRSQDEIKTESTRFASEQLELRDEMINHVYTPLWMGPLDHSF